MIPLAMFLMVCATVYIGTVAAAFAALMRLSLRLDAERHDWLDRLGYLENPVRLFVPLRFLEGVVIVVVATAAMLVTDARGVAVAAIVVVVLVVYVIVFGHLIPLAIVRRDPVRVLALLLPALQIVIRFIGPLALPLFNIVSRGRGRSRRGQSPRSTRRGGRGSTG